MSAGQFVKELALNFGAMVTLIYLTSLVARQLSAADTVKRATVMTAMAIASGWVTILLAVRVGDLAFDLRFLPGAIIALYATRAWVIALVFASVGLARFYFGFNQPAFNGFIIMVLIGIVLAAVHPWVSRKAWNDYAKIVFYVTAAVSINMASMLVLQRSFFPMEWTPPSFRHLGARLKVRAVSQRRRSPPWRLNVWDWTWQSGSLNCMPWIVLSR